MYGILKFHLTLEVIPEVGYKLDVRPIQGLVEILKSAVYTE